MPTQEPIPTNPAPAEVLLFALYQSLLEQEPFAPYHIGDYDHYNDSIIEDEEDYRKYVRAKAASQFFDPSPAYMPPSLANLVVSFFSVFASLNDEGQKHLIEYADVLLSSGKYNR